MAIKLVVKVSALVSDERMNELKKNMADLFDHPIEDVVVIAGAGESGMCYVNTETKQVTKI